MRNAKTLREMSKTLESVIIEDKGNGSSGARFCEIDDELLDRYGDVILYGVEDNQELNDIASSLYDGATHQVSMVSDWIVEGTGDNPFSIRFMI